MFDNKKLYREVSVNKNVGDDFLCVYNLFLAGKISLSILVIMLKENVGLNLPS
jgi:hypothetical protein